MYEKQSEMKIKELRSDNGQEYFLKNSKVILEKKV
jgi:hypothetical protein